MKKLNTVRKTTLSLGTALMLTLGLTTSTANADYDVNAAVNELEAIYVDGRTPSEMIRADRAEQARNMVVTLSPEDYTTYSNILGYKILDDDLDTLKDIAVDLAKDGVLQAVVMIIPVVGGAVLATKAAMKAYKAYKVYKKGSPKFNALVKAGHKAVTVTMKKVNGGLKIVDIQAAKLQKIAEDVVKAKSEATKIYVAKLTKSLRKNKAAAESRAAKAKARKAKTTSRVKQVGKKLNDLAYPVKVPKSKHWAKKANKCFGANKKTRVCYDNLGYPKFKPTSNVNLGYTNKEFKKLLVDASKEKNPRAFLHTEHMKKFGEGLKDQLTKGHPTYNKDLVKQLGGSKKTKSIKEMLEIKSDSPIPGFARHHNESDPNLIQLVSDKFHNTDNPHTGGMKVQWMDLMTGK